MTRRRVIPTVLVSTLVAVVAVVALMGLTPKDSETRRASAQAELGKALFFDTRLSFNDRLSCGTCHQPDKGFGDGQRFSTGATGKTLHRHTPHLYNLAGASSFFWDGRAATLEEQALMPIQNPDELNLPLDVLLKKLESVPYYAKAFDDLYPEDGMTTGNVARAIASFERTLVSRDSSFDRHKAGDSSALDPSALRGEALFFGEARCSRCHKGSNFTDGQFHNTGVRGEDPGRSVFDRVGSFRMRPYPLFQTQRAFKTPGLRNVAESAPYFHDGSEAALEDVVRFYNQGGKDRDSYGLSADIMPLKLDEGGIDDLVSFLESLTGHVEIEMPVVPDASAVYLPLLN